MAGIHGPEVLWGLNAPENAAFSPRDAQSIAKCASAMQPGAAVMENVDASLSDELRVSRIRSVNLYSFAAGETFVWRVTTWKHVSLIRGWSLRSSNLWLSLTLAFTWCTKVLLEILSIYIYIYMCVYMCIYIYIYVCVCVCVFLCVYACTCVHHKKIFLVQIRYLNCPGSFLKRNRNYFFVTHIFKNLYKYL